MMMQLGKSWHAEAAKAAALQALMLHTITGVSLCPEPENWRFVGVISIIVTIKMSIVRGAIL